MRVKKNLLIAVTAAALLMAGARHRHSPTMPVMVTTPPETVRIAGT